MMDEGGKERRKLTFSQREGYAPLPEPLQVGILPQKFKKNIWRLIETSIMNCFTYEHFYEIDEISPRFTGDSLGKFWVKFHFLYHYDILNMPHDEIGIADPSKVQWIKELVLKGEDHEVLTLLECMVRVPDIPQNLVNDIEETFQFALYRIDRSDEPIMIVPVTSEEMKENIKKSLDNINKSDLTGAKSHIRKAGQKLNENDFSNSITESIHAVEAAARQIDPKASKTLGPALNSLYDHGMLKHSALKDAFKNLYGYTNDEEGIRHALIERRIADVGFDEAIFMYAVCVAFIDYLASKQRQMEEK